MSDFEDDTLELENFQEIKKEIQLRKSNPETSGMFVSGWDDVDQDVDVVKNPKENPIDHVLWAAENGELDTLKELLTIHPDLVNACDSDGYTPLHRAAYSNHISIISYLLSIGANIDARTELGWTPLHSACNWNNYGAAARLLVAGANPSAVSDGEQTPMHLIAAVSHSKSTLLVLLFQENIEEAVTKTNKVGEIPVQLASRHGIYSPLFEIVLPAISFIHSMSFTCNPYINIKRNVNNSCKSEADQDDVKNSKGKRF